MEITSILTPERTHCSLQAASKKRAIELAAEHIAANTPDLDIGEVYRGLIERERLGSTAIGEGVAIPHCRMSGCKSIIGSLFVLEEPVDFSAPDEQPVNIMFVLLVPADETTEHLSTLAMLAERFQHQDYREALANATDNEALFRAATRPLNARNAASTRGR